MSPGNQDRRVRLTGTLMHRNIKVRSSSMAEEGNNETVEGLFVVVARAARGGGSDREETSAESPGNSETHMVLSWYGGSE